MKRIIAVGVVFAAFAAVAIVAGRDEWAKTAVAQPRPAREVPKFQVDPSWPKLPAKWVWGQVSRVAVDERDHAWILQRPRSGKIGSDSNIEVVKEAA